MEISAFPHWKPSTHTHRCDAIGRRKKNERKMCIETKKFSFQFSRKILSKLLSSSPFLLLSATFFINVAAFLRISLWIRIKENKSFIVWMRSDEFLEKFHWKEESISTITRLWLQFQSNKVAKWRNNTKKKDKKWRRDASSYVHFRLICKTSLLNPLSKKGEQSSPLSVEYAFT